MTRFQRWENQLGDVYDQMTRYLEAEFGENLDIDGHPLQDIQGHIEEALDGLRYFDRET